MTKAKAGMNNETCVWAELTEWVVLFQAMISLQSQYKHVISAHVIFPLYLDKKNTRQSGTWIGGRARNRVLNVV